MTTLLLFLSALLLSGCALGNAPRHDDQDDHDDRGETKEDHGVVELSPEAVASARITVAPASEGRLTPTLTLPGRIGLDPRKEALVSAWMAGQVDAISVRPGDEVRRGGLLGTVQSPELGEAIAAYRAARARDDAADARLERLQRLEAQGVSSRSQVLEAEASHSEAEGALEAAEERLRILGVDPSIGDPHEGEHYVSHVPLRSPIAGKVLRADAAVGRSVSPGETLFHVGDLSRVWLLVDVYESDLGRVRQDQPVSFTVAAWPGETFRGTVEQVGDWVEPEARTIEVRVVVDNPDGRLKPNMFASATLSVEAQGASSGLVLPASAITEVDGQTAVFVQLGDGRFEVRPVTVLERSASEALVTAGLAVGDLVVIDGAFALKSELEKSELGEGHAH